MKFVDAAQRSDEWHMARLGRVTASRLKDVLAVGKNGQALKKRDDYKRELVTERIVGELGKKDVYVTPEMQWGTMNENTARQIYTLQTGLRASEEGFIQHDELMAGCSTDGLVSDGKTNLEIKCLTSANHLYQIVKQNTMPTDYRDQVQMQLWITERERCHFIGYDSRQPVGLDLFVIEVPRDDLYIQYIDEQTRLFLEEIEADVRHFLRYLPVARRSCRNDGLVFTDKLALCPECGKNNTQIEEILQEAEIKMVERGKIKVFELDGEY